MNVLQHTRNERNPCYKQNRPDRSYRGTFLRPTAHVKPPFGLEVVSFSNRLFKFKEQSNDNFARIKSHCLFSSGFISLAKGISKIRHWSFFCKFPRMFKLRAMSVVRFHVMLLYEMVSDRRSRLWSSMRWFKYCHVYPKMKCIIQITHEKRKINNRLLTHKERFLFLQSDLVLYLSFDLS